MGNWLAARGLEAGGTLLLMLGNQTVLW